MRENKKIITEMLRIQEIMGLDKTLLNESIWDDLFKKGAKNAGEAIIIGGKKISDDVADAIRLANKKLESKTIKLSQSIDDVLKVARKSSPEIVDEIIDVILNHPKISDEYIDILSDASKGIEDLMKNGKSYDDAIKTIEELYDSRLRNNDILPNEIFDRLMKDVKEEIPKPKLDDIEGPTPPKPDLPINFTKFLDGEVTKMAAIARRVNGNAELIVRGDLPGDKISLLEKEILKDMQTLYYSDQKLIESIINEVNQGLKSTNKKIKGEFKKVNDLLNKLPPEGDTSIHRWKSGYVAKDLTNKWKIFANETLKSSFRGWINLYSRFGKIKGFWKKTQEIIDKTMGKVPDDVSEKIATGADKLGWGKRQVNLTFAGSPRGIPLNKGKSGAYDEIIKAFPKNKMGYARASYVLERVIRFVTVSAIIESIYLFLAKIKFYGYHEYKSVQLKYPECIKELTKMFKENPDKKDYIIDEYPECFQKLILDDKGVTESELEAILSRASYFATKGEIVNSIYDSVVNSSTPYKLISGRAQFLNEFLTIINDIEEGQETGNKSILDDYFEEGKKLRSEIEKEYVNPEEGGESEDNDSGFILDF